MHFVCCGNERDEGIVSYMLQCCVLFVVVDGYLFVFVCGDVCGCCGWWVQEGYTALVLAADEGHGSVVEMLLQKEGVDINVTTNKVSEIIGVLLVMNLTSTMTFCVFKE